MKTKMITAGFARLRRMTKPALRALCRLRQTSCPAVRHKNQSLDGAAKPQPTPDFWSRRLRQRSTAGFARLFFAALVCLSLLSFWGTGSVHAQPDRVHVATVVDGDTLRLADGRSLRLAGIDSPELGHGKAPDQMYALEARDLLRRLAAGKPLELRPVNANGKDRHKRVLAEALLPDGASLNEKLLKEGAAYAYWHKDLPHEFWQRMLASQREALREKRGLWGKILQHPVASATYVGNRNSQRFFPEGCKEASRIKPANRVAFADLAAAFTAGYAPARVCVFWPTE